MAAVALATVCLSTAGHAGFLYVPQDGTSPNAVDAGGGAEPQRALDSAASGDARIAADDPAVAKPVSGRWRVNPNEMLRQVLGRWAGRAGMEVLFLTDRRYRLHEGRALRGSFEEATRALFSSLSHLPHPPAGELRPGGANPRGPSSGALGRRRTMRRAGVPMRSLGPLLAGCLGGLATCIAVLSMPDSAVAPPVELSAPEGREPAVVAALRANGARVLSLGKGGGLDGHLVEPADGDAYSLYLTPDGHAVAGLLYGPDGALLTGRQLASAGIADGSAAEAYETRRVSRATPNGENSISGGRSGHEAAHDGETDFLPEYVAGFERPGTGKAERGDISYAATFRLAHADGREPQAPDKGTPWDAEALFARSHSAFGFSVGRSGPAAVVFADPACRWSRAAVTRLARAALDGRLRLRVIPVGVLGAASAREAAAVASARDPALAWFEGAPGPASPEGGRRIALNNTLFDAWGAGAVPLIAWRARDGRVAQRVGDVEDVDAWLEGLTDE